MYLLGLDIGSSSIKATILDAQTGRVLSGATAPATEAKIHAPQPGWAQQDPDHWWKHAIEAVTSATAKANVSAQDISAIGIAYQMHGLVLVDQDHRPLRPAIIWCDSRAVEIGQQAFLDLGEQRCLTHLLNSPGNFTASKLKWVQTHEPQVYKKIHKVLLPGDYIALKLTGQATTTLSGLSEGILWDFKQNQIAHFLLEHYQIDPHLLADITPTFGHQGQLTRQAATSLGLKPGTPVTYRAGDQPNNAFSLNVLHPGELAATAGTSGVVYGISDSLQYDDLSRVNTFAHVNHQHQKMRLGVLLCINGTGILNSWLKKWFGSQTTYQQMNQLAQTVEPGSQGLSILPFGNGAERILQNKNIGAHIANLDLNQHTQAHLARAVQEGIVFAFALGLNIMQQTGIKTATIRAGHTNMFQSAVFTQTLADITGAVIQLYDTDGSQGAARAAGVGEGIYPDAQAALASLKAVKQVTPNKKNHDALQDAYARWSKQLQHCL